MIISYELLNIQLSSFIGNQSDNSIRITQHPAILFHSQKMKLKKKERKEKKRKWKALHCSY